MPFTIHIHDAHRDFDTVVKDPATAASLTQSGSCGGSEWEGTYKEITDSEELVVMPPASCPSVPLPSLFSLSLSFPLPPFFPPSSSPVLLVVAGRRPRTSKRSGYEAAGRRMNWSMQFFHPTARHGFPV